MVLDIVIGMVAATAQAVTGYLGWQVTTTPPNKQRKILYTRLFKLCGAVGLLAVTWGVVSASRQQDALGEQIRNLRSQLANKRLGAYLWEPVYEVRHAAGKPIDVNVTLTNRGDEDAFDIQVYSYVAVLPTDTPKPDYSTILVNELQQRVKSNRSCQWFDPVRKGSKISVRLDGPVLSSLEEQELGNRTHAIYSIFAVYYSDDGKETDPRHFTSFCKQHNGDLLIGCAAPEGWQQGLLPQTLSVQPNCTSSKPRHIVRYVLHSLAVLAALAFLIMLLSRRSGNAMRTAS